LISEGSCDTEDGSCGFRIQEYITVLNIVQQKPIHFNCNNIS